MTTLDRFWSHVDVRGFFDCWEWRGSRNSRGGEYGRFRTGGKAYLAHRWIYQELNGGISQRQVVRHDCDNPACVNPMHLQVGTQKQNMNDASVRGHMSHFGERNSSAKLTTEQVQEIRSNTEASRVVAERYGVSKSQINNIRRGGSWPDHHIKPSFAVIGAIKDHENDIAGMVELELDQISRRDFGDA